MDLGNAIKEIRSKLGLTQNEVCEMTGLTQGFYSHIENGNSIPSIPTLSKIGAAFKIPVFFIISLATNKNELPKIARRCHEDIKTIIESIINNE